MNSLIKTGFGRTSLVGSASCPLKSHVPNVLQTAFGLAVLLFNLLIVSYGGPAASFFNTTPLLTARSGQTATLLSNGKLLVAGGQTNGAATSSTAELYDPGAGTWVMSSPMNADRAQHTATM